MITPIEPTASYQSLPNGIITASIGLCFVNWKNNKNTTAKQIANILLSLKNESFFKSSTSKFQSLRKTIILSIVSNPKNLFDLIIVLFDELI